MAEHDLDNMKRLDRVQVRAITDRILTQQPLHIVREIEYGVVADDGELMFVEHLTHDAGKEPVSEGKTFEQRYSAALAKAKAHAEGKYGRSKQK